MLVCLKLLALLCGILHVEASHFRYGIIAYKVPDPINNPRTVEFAFETGWRSSFIGDFFLDFGDGARASFSANQGIPKGTLTDGSGAQYSLFENTLTHTYSQVGDYVAYYDDCCRIGDLKNHPNGYIRLETTVALLSGEQISPRAAVPATVQMFENSFNSFDVLSSISDLDAGDVVSCSYNTGSDDGFSPVPSAGGNSLVVTNDCKLEWDLQNYNSPTTFDKYSVSMNIEIDDKQFVQSLDFAIELNKGTPLTCPPRGPVQLTANLGDTVRSYFDVNGDGNVGDVTVSWTGLGHVHTNSGPADPLPGEWEYHYMVPVGAPIQSQTVIQWGLGTKRCSQTVTITVNCLDIDEDGNCDVCPDYDNDGVCDSDDNCPTTANGDQTDSDGDGYGDACDVCAGFDDNLDYDGDGHPDDCDNCPTVHAHNQDDTDNDGVGDACDGCPNDPNKIDPGRCGCGFDDAVEDPDGDSVCGSFAGMVDDPHLKSWSGEWFDYMGECDLKLLHAPKFDGKQDMGIDVRTSIRRDYSYIEAAAVRIGEDVFEVGSFGDFALNGVDGARRTDRKIPKVGGYQVHYTQVNKKKHKFDIVIAENENVTINTFKDWVSVKIFHGDEKRFGAVSGLMGTYDGKMLARDGTNLHDDINALGQDWQVLPEEGNIFRTVRAPQYPEKCRLPGPHQETGRRLGKSLAKEAAEKACAHLIGAAHSFCVHDVMVSGDLDMADSGAF